MANMITGIRIICALFLIFCPTFSNWFFMFYVLGGLSDVFDGAVARYLGQETKFGAKLDTLADIVFTTILIIKMILAVHIPLWLFIWIVGIAVIKCFSLIYGFVVYKRFVPEHTIMNKICGVLLFVIPFFIKAFSCQTVMIMIVITCLAATFSAIQEGYYIYTGNEVI